MNRRLFLSAVAATSLTPIMPPQVFASGGIVNPDHCGFILKSPPCQAWATPAKSWVGASPAQILADINTMLEATAKMGVEGPYVLHTNDPVLAALSNGDGRPWRGGLIRT